MKNRDTILVLLVLTLVGLFLWQLIQNLNKAVENVSTKDTTGADQLTAKINAIDQTVTNAIPDTPVDYLSAYQTSL